MLRWEGWRDNHKRIYRLYREQGLSLSLKRPRRNESTQRRQPQPQPSLLYTSRAHETRQERECRLLLE
ncbi:hypothetical protein HEK63_017125 [Escherichia coli]|nr:hypothetical protein [Escherichia coli]